MPIKNYTTKVPAVQTVGEIQGILAAQVALVETEQATMDELFFPKLIDRNEKTLYEVFQTGQLMLGDGG